MATFYSPRIVTNGLVLHLDAGNNRSYPGSGNAWSDISRNGIVGTLFNGPTFTNSNGGAIVFDGTNDRVETGTNFSTYITGSNSFTIECWVYPGATQAQYADIWGNHTDNVTGIVCQQNSTNTNQYNWGYGNGISWATSTGSGFFNLTALQWSHLIAMKSATNLFTYLNGVLINTVTTSTLVAANPSIGFQIGTGYNLGSSRYFNGRVSNFRIYSRGLSASEVRQNYNATKGRYGLL